MNKVTLTQNQAIAIEKIRNLKSYGELVEIHVKTNWINNELSTLNELDTHTFIVALYGSYEIKGDFEKGNFLMDDKGLIMKVIEITDDGIRLDGEGTIGGFYGNKSQYYNQLKYASHDEINKFNIA